MIPALAPVLALFYPSTCVVCEDVLVSGEEYICTRCRRDLPYSYAGHPELELKFAGVCRIDPVYSLFHYHRESRYKNLIYNIKYYGNKNLGVFIGKLLGEKIKGKVAAEIILPVPLHRKRERKRGFNQSAQIARGISSVLHLPVREDVIRRVCNNPSQTGLNSGERTKNVENIFAIEARELLAGKHVLLVDDVVTTGATLTSCLKELGTVPGIRVSVACLAYARFA
ncbi:MAG: ComF family protein [Odoribacteraceae bacterium]|jgi:ComF family protein|nr:ComF family protein [Odoribacteraceae bacterium]